VLCPGLRLLRSLTLASVELAVDVGRPLGADEVFDVEPRQLRRLLLSFDGSIQGRIPEILGRTEDERVDTLVRLLRGTSEEDMNVLLESFQVALRRLDRERRRAERRRDRHS
jgi:hypothetical protein